jgi:hypothetical protein
MLTFRWRQSPRRVYGVADEAFVVAQRRFTVRLVAAREVQTDVHSDVSIMRRRQYCVPRSWPSGHRLAPA